LSITITQLICIDHCTLHLSQERFVFAQSTKGNFAFGTPAGVDTGHKDLFWVVTNKNSKDRVALPPDPITTFHFNTSFAI